MDGPDLLLDLGDGLGKLEKFWLELGDILDALENLFEKLEDVWEEVEDALSFSQPNNQPKGKTESLVHFLSQPSSSLNSMRDGSVVSPIRPGQKDPTGAVTSFL